MKRIKFSGLSLVVLCASLSACGGRADTGDEAAAFDSPPASVEINGRTFLRRDLWSDDDFQRVVYEGRAEQPATTPEVLAAQLRAHTLYHGTYYLELEPNLELANKVLAGEAAQGTAPQEPYQGRRVIGPDNRSFYTSANTYPGTTFGFNDTEGTGNVVSATTVYTAAHVIYLQGGGFYCQNGTTSPTGSCAASPGWRFGVQGTTGFTNWTANFCYRETLTNAYISLNASSDQWDSARWDYAVIDLSGCAALNTGWLGTWTASDSTLQTMTAYNFGYAERATCPNNAMGQDGRQGVTGSTDCPGTGAWPGSTWQAAAPFSSSLPQMIGVSSAWRRARGSRRTPTSTFSIVGPGKLTTSSSRIRIFRIERHTGV